MYDIDEPVDEREIAEALGELVARLARDPGRRREIVEKIYEICLHAGPVAASAVPTLIECLSDADEQIGEHAQYGLKYCGPDAVEPLIDSLGHPEATVRRRACDALGGIGEDALPAIDALRRALEDASDAVRPRAAWALGAIGDTGERTIEALFRLTSAAAAGERASALHALSMIGRALVDHTPLFARASVAIDALEDADEDVRWSALCLTEALDYSPAERVDLLVRMLNEDESARVRGMLVEQMKALAGEIDLSPHVPLLAGALDRAERREAVVTCELFAEMGPGAEAAVPTLHRLLENDDLGVYAAKALWKIERDARPLLPALARLMPEDGEGVCDLICEMGAAAAPLVGDVIAALETDDYWDLQWAAVDALGAIASGDPAALEALLSALRHDSGIVRGAAANALATIGEDAVPALIAILEDADDPRGEWASEALARMGHRGAAASAVLLRATASPSPALRFWSAIALAYVTSDAAAAPVLLEALHDDDATVRRRAALALGEIRPTSAGILDALRTAVEDEDLEVGEAAAAAIEAVSAPLQ